MEFEIPHHKEDRDKQAEELSVNREAFDEMMKIFISGKAHPRIGWTLTFAIEKNPGYAEKWIPNLIEVLTSTSKDDDKRNILRSFQFLEMNDQQIPIILDLCYKVLNSSSEKPAARVFAMTVIYNQVQKYPDLGGELHETLKELFPFGSAGFRSRARKIMISLEKEQ